MKKLISGPGFNHLVSGRHGYVLYNCKDRYIGRSVEHYGEWSPEEATLLGQLCRPGHYVVDAGAHIGTHTLAFARMVGDRGRVFAFEPQRLMAQLLAANVALNSLTNVHTYHLAVGEGGTVWLHDDLDYSRSNNFGGASLDAITCSENDPCRKYRVTVVRLDDFYDEPRLDLIKVDVEGMEADVLRGAAGLIRRHKPVLYVENDRLEQSTELITLIRSYGYRLFWHCSPLYSPDNFAGSTRMFTPEIVSVNMLCIHETVATQTNLDEITDPSARPCQRKAP